ncbi:putative membrane protein [Aequitasia blattaphilus]|uniref:DUF1700 domain-containing protein n=1 Tax=Aequitasia blattaphilus TaxID=2949332 RepID=A0ABT1E9X4_9FIRM|nr:DUF1700 domain-containing protein [Aequitasia blattaphilus]MCP1102623.1 DUF1700 domain-containing protein [Aequitasia blattaphilus]MCR8615263.1 DUF1700 domain-containing protein [Aequitasia blattaphilus]
MKRREFMAELSSLLISLPLEERNEALAYYEAYFDDAGADKEEEVIRELKSPRDVAATIIQNADQGSYNTASSQEVPYNPGRGQQEGSHVNSQNNSVLKIVVLILAIIILGPVVIPVAFSIVVAIAALFFSILIASFAIAIAGVATLVLGFALLIPELVVGIAVIGIGLILLAIGIVASVASVRLCMVGIPGICRFIVNVCRMPFNRKVVA